MLRIKLYFTASFNLFISILLKTKISDCTPALRSSTPSSIVNTAKDLQPLFSNAIAHSTLPCP